MSKDVSDERSAKALAVLEKLFPPGMPGPPRFEYPPEIQDAWTQLSTLTVMGDVWGRPALDLKQRAMLSIAALTVLDKPEQLKAYIIGGLNAGLSRSEVCETIFQMAIYGGFPAAIQGFAAANEVFKELDGD